MPLAVRGKTNGISLLFPMEKLFERYVEVQLRKQLPAHYRLKSQARSKYLCTLNENNMFQLRPDLLIQCGEIISLVLDTKWKLLSAVDTENKFGLSQNDFYQLFAYGHKYLKGKGEMLLIYPHTKTFPDLRHPFVFSPDLRLWVVSFDLENDKMQWPDHWYELIFTTLSYME